MADLALVSYRLGGTDGVAVESAKWIHALSALGHRVRTVAGEGVADVIVEGLAMSASVPPSSHDLDAALGAADLVIVENLASLPLNPGAREVLYEVLEHRQAIFHHHDLASQRPHLAHLDPPRDNPRWRHVTINELSRRELLDAGIEAETIMNSFDCDPPLGDRHATRAALGLTNETLALLPSRALARKNVEGALSLCRALNAVFWLLGPAEDDFEATLEQLIEDSGVEVRRGLESTMSVHDAYGASDLVVMSSTWEGFGNPVIESVTHRRPLALHPYPVAREILAYGFDFFGLDEVGRISRFLARPDDAVLDANLAIARRHFNLDDLAERLAALVDSTGVS